MGLVLSTAVLVLDRGGWYREPAMHFGRGNRNNKSASVFEASCFMQEVFHLLPKGQPSWSNRPSKKVKLVVVR